MPQLFTASRRPILDGVIAPIQRRFSKVHRASMFGDHAPDFGPSAPIFGGISVYRKFFAGISAKVEEDGLKRVIVLKVSRDAGDKLTRTKVDPFLHLVPA